MLLDVRSGEMGLMQSTLPLTSRNPEGVSAPVNLSLVGTDDGDLTTVNSLSDIVIHDTDPSAELKGVDAGLGLDGAAPSQAVKTNDRAFYYEVARDTDAVIDPRPTGFEFSLILRSADAPQSFALRATGSPDTRFREAGQGVPEGVPHGFTLRQGDSSVGYVSPAAAVDAAGRPVAVTMTADGPRHLRLSVPHGYGGITYPVLVDPEVESDFGDSGWPGWRWGQDLMGGSEGFFCASSNSSGAAYCPTPQGQSSYSGFYQAMAAGVSMNNAAYALWRLDSPPGTGIYALNLGGVQHAGADCGGSPCAQLFSGITTPNEANWEAPPTIEPASFAARPQSYCSTPCTRSGPGTGSGNHAWFGLQKVAPSGTTSNAVDAVRMFYAQLLYQDFIPPRIVSATGSSSEPLEQTAWSSGQNRTILVRAHDDGAGLAGSSAGNQGAIVIDGVTRAYANCSAAQFQCDNDLPASTSSAPQSVTYSRLEGVNTHTLRAYDEFGLQSSDVTWNENVDLHAPVISYTGPGDQSTITGPVNVTVSATDSGGSGLGSLSATVRDPAGTTTTRLSQAGSFTLTPSAFGVYTITVTARDASSPGNATTNVYRVTYANAPAAPAKPTAVAGDRQATVSWTTPASNGATISKYTVTAYDAATSQVAGTPVTVTTGTRATVSGLTNGTSYQFTVSATNAVGNGGESVKSDAVTPVARPDVVAKPAAVAGDAQVTLTWTAPNNNGAAISKYTVYTYKNNIKMSGYKDVTSGTQTTITGLANNSAYQFTVTATNSVGTSADSTRSDAVTPRAVVGAPNAPAKPTALAGDRQAAVSWTAPANNGAAIVKYTVRTYDSSGQEAVASVDVTTGTKITVTGLSNGSSYQFTVSATNAVGTSNESVPSDAVAPAAQPDQITKPTAVPAGNGQLAVNWTAPIDNGAAITKYTVQTYRNNIKSGTGKDVTSGTQTTITGLTNGTNYQFTVTATNSVGVSSESTKSDAVSPVADRPDAPAKPTATAGAGQATVDWIAPANNGATISKYTVTPYNAPSGTAGTPVTVASGTAATITGLTNGTSYQFTVAATNSTGTSTESARSDAITPKDKPGQVAKPTAIAGDSQATVNWTAPSDNGAPITKYTVTTRVGTGSIFSTKDVTSGTQTTITGLTNGTSYTFTVAATNSVGKGTASPASDASTPFKDSTPPTITISGSLAASGTISSAATDFSIQATDGVTGSNATRGSGVRIIDVFVNDALAYSTGQRGCTPDSCELSLNDTLSVDDFGQGALDVRAEVSDQQGNLATKTIQPFVDTGTLWDEAAGEAEALAVQSKSPRLRGTCPLSPTHATVTRQTPNAQTSRSTRLFRMLCTPPARSTALRDSPHAARVDHEPSSGDWQTMTDLGLRAFQASPRPSQIHGRHDSA